MIMKEAQDIYLSVILPLAKKIDINPSVLIEQIFVKYHYGKVRTITEA